MRGGGKDKRPAARRIWAASQGGRPGRAGHIIVCPALRGKRVGNPSRLKLNSN